jgi:hypothetical protein
MMAEQWLVLYFGRDVVIAVGCLKSGRACLLNSHQSIKRGRNKESFSRHTNVDPLVPLSTYFQRCRTIVWLLSWISSVCQSVSFAQWKSEIYHSAFKMQSAEYDESSPMDYELSLAYFKCLLKQIQTNCYFHSDLTLENRVRVGRIRKTTTPHGPKFISTTSSTTPLLTVKEQGIWYLLFGAEVQH